MPHICWTSLSYYYYVEQIVNFIFILYYMVEQTLLLVCMGWRRFKYHASHMLDLIIVLLLCVSNFASEVIVYLHFLIKSGIFLKLVLCLF